ncbi:hypothetical protein H257_10091 [Aphanomyces astaci]|uniref:Uncharacterized protein n=1 Tax=Aphanomyces astaci TaxID=112090 RepID=W4G7R9_APHAT|nr:hypothetical protein H257_10091 [Aphanomyces astaci]ETV75710.1 hypothetical protein H257_10091 [Aphanomyces astaci]|eukprot:XP_009834841.1 hypothetical protein H257_10091 [Aphanomyces astaci]
MIDFVLCIHVVVTGSTTLHHHPTCTTMLQQSIGRRVTQSPAFLLSNESMDTAAAARPIDTPAATRMGAFTQRTTHPSTTTALRKPTNPTSNEPLMLHCVV